jgi:predicted ATPase
MFITGPNASGKSNLLDSMRFLRDLAKPGGGLQSALRLRGGLGKIRCLAARAEPNVEICVHLGEGESRWEYRVVLGQEVRGFRQAIVKEEVVLRDGKVVLQRPDGADKKDQERLTQTALEQINANVEFREVDRFLESIRYLHLVPQLVRNPEAYQGVSANEDPFGRNFLEQMIKTPEKTRRSRLRKIEKALQKAVPQLKELVDVRDEVGVPHLEAVYQHWRKHGARQREDQFSDGTLRMIGLFWALLDGDAPLLLEEPELSLHAAVVSKLPGLFAGIQRQSKRQIFVSTHSVDLLNDAGIGYDEVLILRPGEDGTSVTQASEEKQIVAAMKAGLGAGEAIVPGSGAQLGLFDLNSAA